MLKQLPRLSVAPRTLSFVVVLLQVAISVTGQRAIQNPSVQNPSIVDSSNERISENTLLGWLTTHPTGSCGVGPASCRPIERWSTGFNSVDSSTDAGAGNAWVELNADVNSMIYQPVCMTNGESFTYSFLHRGRSSNSTGDVAQFRMGIPTGLPAGSRPSDTYSFPIASVTTAADGNPGSIANNGGVNGTVNPAAGAGNGWVRYGGTYTYTGTTQTVNLGFVAVSTAGGDLSIGNFIDNWTIALAPYIEASAASTSFPEGEGGGSTTPAQPNGPALRLSGTVTSAATIQVSRTGGSATIGSDYSLTVPFENGNTNNTVTINVPVGVYDGVTNGVFPIPFSTRDDFLPEPDETVQFTIGTVTGAQLASISACGLPPISTFTHTILNDDVVTAARVLVSGRVIGQDDRGIARAWIEAYLPDGSSKRVSTNSFGYFNITGYQAGSLVILTVGSKRHSFEDATRTFVAFDDVSGLEFRAAPVH